jgi:hypothetical protein
MQAKTKFYSILALILIVGIVFLIFITKIG